MNTLMKKLLPLVCAVIFLLSLHPAWALTVSPPTRELAGNPGDALLTNIVLYNETNQPLTLYPAVMNFSAGKDEAGQPQFYPADQDPYGSALAQWIKTPPQAITLAVKQRVGVSLAINIPKNAVPGGHYGAVLFGTTPPLVDGAVGINSQVAVLLLVRVNGKIVEQGRIAEFSRASKQNWYTALPVDFALRFENDGNTHLRPSGTIFVTNLLSQQVAAIPINATSRNVLPQSIRKFVMDWQNQKSSKISAESILGQQWNNFAFGPYTARAVVQYGTSGKTETAETSFVVFPWQLLLVIALGLIGAAMILHALIVKYNRWIIKRG